MKKTRKNWSIPRDFRVSLFITTNNICDAGWKYILSIKLSENPELTLISTNCVTFILIQIISRFLFCWCMLQIISRFLFCWCMLQTSRSIFRMMSFTQMCNYAKIYYRLLLFCMAYLNEKKKKKEKVRKGHHYDYKI
jgi:hypothetical protein